jgi:serine/threonine protein kinase
MSSKKQFKQIGKGGLFTSFLVTKPLLKQIFKGGTRQNCQQKINDEILDPQNKQWLQISSVIQNIQGKGIATILGKIASDSVVIKAQSFQTAQHELLMQQTLKNANLPGIVDYECSFSCAGDRDYVESFAYYGESTRLCTTVGIEMGVIIMPYYKVGSFNSLLENYNKNDKRQKIKSIIHNVITNYTTAYITCQFTHGDLFPKNIVLDSNYNPILIDFEKSMLNAPRRLDRFWQDVDGFLGEIARYTYVNELYDIMRVITCQRAYNVESALNTNIKDILQIISNLPN